MDAGLVIPQKGLCVRVLPQKGVCVRVLIQKQGVCAGLVLTQKRGECAGTYNLTHSQDPGVC